MATENRNIPSVKALKSFMAKEKKISRRTFIEWQMAFNTNGDTDRKGGFDLPNKVWNQDELLKLFDRYGENSKGCSKAVHFHNHEGDPFKYIVVGRLQNYAYIPDAEDEHEKCSGNQILDQIQCWKELAVTPDGDMLCPLLKWFTSKSDKVSATSNTMQRNIFYIAQKAVYVNNAENCCVKAAEMNRENGFHGESAVQRLSKMKVLSNKMGWRDAIHNRGNSGVIFDYAQNCYKAVFIDYAL